MEIAPSEEHTRLLIAHRVTVVQEELQELSPNEIRLAASSPDA